METALAVFVDDITATLQVRYDTFAVIHELIEPESTVATTVGWLMNVPLGKLSPSITL